jgi:hypothetical protein
MGKLYADRIAEGILLALIVLAPWGFGGVDAEAELALYAGVAAIALLRVVAGGGVNLGGWATLGNGLNLGLAGLVGLCLAQAVALPDERALGVLAPAKAALRAELLPLAPERVDGDPGPVVPLPPPTLSLDPERTWDVAARLAAAWILLQAVVGLAADPRALRRLSLTLVVNAAALALFTMIQVLTWNGRHYGVRPTISDGHGGPFVCHSHLAAYLNLGLGFALAALLAPGAEPGSGPGPGGPPARGRRSWAAYAAGLIVAGVLVSLSRNGFLAMTVASLGLLLTGTRWSRRGIGRGLLTGLVGLAAILALAAGLLVAFGNAGASDRLATLLTWRAYDPRWKVWTGVARAVADAPLWGVGYGAYGSASARFHGDWVDQFVAHVESEYLQALVEGGLIGLGLTLVIAGSALGLGLRAVTRARGTPLEAPARGLLFGVIALAVQGLGDFPLHIPALGIAAVVLGGFLIRLGGQGHHPATASGTGPAPPTEGLPGRRSWAGGIASRLFGGVLALVALALVGHGLTWARASAALWGTPLPAPGSEKPTATLWGVSAAELDRARVRLERALAQRPDWSEGRLRLGMVHLSRYAATATALLERERTDPARIETLADPLWLHRVIHTLPPEQLAAAGGPLGQPPVRDHLVPAARQFLEARRCSPVLALAHAELASLDYLLIGGDPDPARVHARRAIRLAGNETETLAVAAQAAAQAGDLETALLGLRRLIQTRPDDWRRVADAVAGLPPERVLEEVAVRGRTAVLFAEHLYGGPDQRGIRDRFLRAGIARLPQDPDLTPAQRLRFEALAWARLDDPDQAIARMTAALAREPTNLAWRQEFVNWLIGWGRWDEARRQALAWRFHAPDQPQVTEALARIAEGQARGDRSTPPGSPVPAANP